MQKLDHLTVIAPTLDEGVSHVRNCLDLDVPFGTRHGYMGTHNHRLQLGDGVYLEIIALDPDCMVSDRARWFDLDDPKTVRSDWEDGRRLRGWVACTVDIVLDVRRHPGVFGKRVSLPTAKPEFDFSIPSDGSLPLDGAAPSLIDHRGDPTSMADIPDLEASLQSVTLEHPDPASIAALYHDLEIDRPPEVVPGSKLRYREQIDAPRGQRELTSCQSKGGFVPDDRCSTAAIVASAGAVGMQARDQCACLAQGIHSVVAHVFSTTASDVPLGACRRPPG